MKKGDLRCAVARDNALNHKVIHGVEAERFVQTVDVLPRANFRFNFPKLESVEQLSDLSKLRGMMDLDKVVALTGSVEIGPWGSVRTRWEMEARGELTIEGAIEMAWMMGFIKYFNEPADDKDVKGRYEKDVLAHAGVRLTEPELFSGYDPNKTFQQEIELTYDEPIAVTESEAHKYKLHGDKRNIWAGGGDQWLFKLKKGACVFVPKSFSNHICRY
ncbi:fatty acid synthase alpha subunit Lsd1 [Stygiomarasmius scandens]|uniref:Fatty acid synthase alpha subunit Lsd1 n=1 Tax=Marasmiellus scandens TaxID=2682957 RepID=A0ABR1JTU7_9AGAR